MRGARITGAGVSVACLFWMIRAVSAAEGSFDVEAATQKVIGFDQRVHIMALELEESPPLSSTHEDERVVDAELLQGLGKHALAAAVLIGVIERSPTTRAARDARFLVAESLFQLREYHAARIYFEVSLQAWKGHRREQKVLERLVETALLTSDFEHVEDYLRMLTEVPAALREPSVPYVRAKYFYFRNRLDDAAAAFAAIGPSSPYLFQARYFLATIHVKKNELVEAMAGYDAIVRGPAPGGGAAREVQDVARLAAGRILYQWGQFERAIEFYRQISPESQHAIDALFELGWSYINVNKFELASRAFERLLLARPDGADAPELRILVGNLQFRLGDFWRARDAFTLTRDNLSPIAARLRAAIEQGRTDPSALRGVLHDTAAAKWLRADPEVYRMIALASGLSETHAGLAAGDQTLGHIEVTLANPNRVRHFAHLQLTRKNGELIRDALGALRPQLAAKAAHTGEILVFAAMPSLGDGVVAGLRPATLQPVALRPIVTPPWMAMLVSRPAATDPAGEALSRVDAVQSHIDDLNLRIDDEADKRVAVLQDEVASEREQLLAAQERLALLDNEATIVVDNLLGAAITRVADRVGDFVVRADVGLIDVAWGFKERKTSDLNDLLTHQRREIEQANADLRQALDETGRRHE